ncbi:MAG: hypothetical protein ACRD59_09955 [Candidatus Acidiferrales bacterium]
MKLARTVAALLLGVALCSTALAQPALAAGPKWFHHEKKSPNSKKVHHAKPSHHPSKRKAPKHHS